MVSNSTSGTMSEASPSKDLVVYDTAQLERNQDKSSLQLSADVPFLSAPEFYGYSIIGGNVVSPRNNMTHDHQVLSLHYFHYYSILD